MTQQEKLHDSIPIRVRFAGLDAESNRVEAHAGSTSILGLTRSIQIASHAYLNHEPVSRGTALKGAELFLIRTSPGSLLFDFSLDVLRGRTRTVANRDSFFDFMATVFSRAVGKEYEPETDFVKKLDRDEHDDLIDLTVEEVEYSLKQGHRAIGRTISDIAIERPRTSSKIIFDQETKEYIEASITADEHTGLEGHVTRFNSITGNGRAYINSFGRIVPFRLSETFLQGKRGLITWSLHGSNTQRAKSLVFDSLEISSSNGTVKRLIVTDCTQGVEAE